MKKNYAKVIIKGSPITKSNFKLYNTQGRAILPNNTGKYHDRYAVYEEQIALEARHQNPNVILDESLIAILKVYYKSEKRHPDTINITKSIFDGIEKSGLIINDVQIVKIITEEYYDKENPRFELELFGESSFKLTYGIEERISPKEPILHLPKKKSTSSKTNSKDKKTTTTTKVCNICGCSLKEGDYISADNNTTLICRKCFRKCF